MKEELMMKYQEEIWLSATQTVDSFLESEEVDKAIEFAKEAIKNWEEEGKLETIERYKKWLKERSIDIN